jgi:hypothetical protein
LALVQTTKAAITPGTHPHNVNRVTINIVPQPMSNTANGGKKIQINALPNPILSILLSRFRLAIPRIVLWYSAIFSKPTFGAVATYSYTHFHRYVESRSICSGLTTRDYLFKFHVEPHQSIWYSLPSLCTHVYCHHL